MIRRNQNHAIPFPFCQVRAEKNNTCVARALSVLLDVPFCETEALAKSYNPKHGNKVANSAVARLMEDLGFRFVNLSPHNASLFTGGRICQIPTRQKFETLRQGCSLPTRGKIMVWIRGHVFAMINGVIYDSWNCQKTGKVRIEGYWTASKESS